MTKPLTAILIGAGNRGFEAYGSYALNHPDQIRFTTVAELQEKRLKGSEGTGPPLSDAIVIK